MSIDMFFEIAAQLFPTASFVDLRGWGESTIIPNFEEYLNIALSYPAKVKLITNGTVKKPALWKHLGRSGITIGISFDAAEAALFRQIRGGADLEQILNNLSLLTQSQVEAGHDPHEKLYFCTTVGGNNLDQLEAIVELGRTLGIRRFKLEPLWAPAENPNRLEKHADRIPAVLQRLSSLSAEHGLLIELSAVLPTLEVRQSAVRKTCIHPWEYVYINSKGRLGFCDHLNGREEFTFGSWQEGFDSFWNGRDMRQLRAEHLARLEGPQIQRCIDCNWCYEHRYMDLEDWIDPTWSDYRVTV